MWIKKIEIASKLALLRRGIKELTRISPISLMQK
jgi:hypothetical protein